MSWIAASNVASSGSHDEGGRLVRDRGADVLGVRRRQRQQVDPTPARAEAVDGSDAERLDHPVQVLAVLLGGTSVVPVGLRPVPRGS